MDKHLSLDTGAHELSLENFAQVGPILFKCAATGTCDNVVT